MEVWRWRNEIRCQKATGQQLALGLTVFSFSRDEPYICLYTNESTHLSSNQSSRASHSAQLSAAVPPPQRIEKRQLATEWSAAAGPSGLLQRYNGPLRSGPPLLEASRQQPSCSGLVELQAKNANFERVSAQMMCGLIRLFMLLACISPCHDNALQLQRFGKAAIGTHTLINVLQGMVL